MDKKLTFNEDAANYDQWRPRYCGELFGDIIQYSRITSGKLAIEIGCGTGQATEPILKTGCSVMAVELGDALALFAKRKFKDYSNFQVQNTAFETFQCGQNRIDLIYSATAFHWIPEEIGYTKAFELLKKGGTLALFWNRPSRPNDALNQKLQTIYDRYTAKGKFPLEGRTTGRRPPVPGQAICDTLLNYGFAEVESHVYKQARVFRTENYISLLNTYSDHIAMQAQDQKQFYREIKSVINGFGGNIEIHDTMDLYLARKP